MRVVLAVIVAATVAWVVPASAEPKKIQCWTDKDGHRMCGDRVPPEYAGQKRDVIQGGRVVQSTKAAKTAEEIAAEKKAKEAAEAAQKQAAYDRDLLETYRSAKDMEQMRDERIALIDSRITSAQKNSESTDKSLADLRARAETLTKNGKPIDDRLAKQIKDYEKSQKQNTRAMERYKIERDNVETKFNSDIARYNQLKGLPPPKPATPATVPPATAAKPESAAPAPAAASSAPAEPSRKN
jgi:hypothetical protein